MYNEKSKTKNRLLLLDFILAGDGEGKTHVKYILKKSLPLYPLYLFISMFKSVWFFSITILLFCLSEIHWTKYCKWVHNAEVFTSRTSLTGNLVVLTLLLLFLLLLFLLLLPPFCTLLQFACAVPRKGTHIGGLGPTQWKGGALDLKRRVVLCCWCVALFIFFERKVSESVGQLGVWEERRRNGRKLCTWK